MPIELQEEFYDTWKSQFDLLNFSFTSFVHKDYNLNKTIYKSTRKGFIELKGSFKFYTNRGDILYCASINDDKKKMTFRDHVRNKPNRQIKIETKNATYTIFEDYQKILKTVDYHYEHQNECL